MKKLLFALLTICTFQLSAQSDLKLKLSNPDLTVSRQHSIGIGLMTAGVLGMALSHNQDGNTVRDMSWITFGAGMVYHIDGQYRSGKYRRMGLYDDPSQWGVYTNSQLAGRNFKAGVLAYFVGVAIRSIGNAQVDEQLMMFGDFVSLASIPFFYKAWTIQKN